MVEGLELTVEQKYTILTDPTFLQQYPGVKEIAKILDNSATNGNRSNILEVFRRLGTKDLGQYLEKLSQGDQQVATHYGVMYRMFARKL